MFIVVVYIHVIHVRHVVDGAEPYNSFAQRLRFILIRVLETAHANIGSAFCVTCEQKGSLFELN